MGKVLLNDVEDEGRRRNLIARTITIILTTVYAIVAFVVVYFDEIKAYVHDDEMRSRMLQAVSNSSTNGSECVFPRPDGTFPPNPKCQSWVSIAFSKFIPQECRGS
jgi:hypothetical protein